MPTLLPPKRLAPPPATPPAPEAAPTPAPAPAVAVVKKAPPLKPVTKAIPKAVAKAAPKAAPKAVAKKPPLKVKAVAKKVPAKKAPPVKSTPKAATENVVPKIPKVKTRIWSDEAVELAVIIVEMKKAIPIVTKKRIEVRNVPERLQVLLNEKVGINCLKCYSRTEDVAKILKFLQRVPEELLPFKWPTAFEKLSKFIDKHTK